MTPDSASPAAPVRGRYAVVLAIAAVLILLLGLMLRPAHVPQGNDVVAPPSQTELERLARMAQRRALDNQIDFFAALGRDLAGSVRLVPDFGATAIVWDAGVLLTAALDAPVPATLAVNGPRGTLHVQRIAGGPQSPVAVLRLDPSVDLPPVSRANARPAPGAPLVIVWHGPAGRGAAPTLFVGVRPRTCGQVRGEEAVTSMTLDRSLAGAGAFDLDQRLVAVVLACGDGFAAITAGSVDAMAAAAVAEASTPAGAFVQRYGIKISGGMRDTDTRLFGLRSPGLYVEEIWDAYRSAAAFDPGDVVETLDGAPVGTLADFVTRATALSPHVIGIRRGTRRLSVPLTVPASDMAVAGSAPPTRRWPHSPALALVVDALPDGTAARAGLRPGDHILSMNGSPPVQSRLIGLLTRPTPTLLTIARPGRRLAIIVR